MLAHLLQKSLAFRVHIVHLGQIQDGLPISECRFGGKPALAQFHDPSARKAAFEAEAERSRAVVQRNFQHDRPEQKHGEGQTLCSLGDLLLGLSVRNAVPIFRQSASSSGLH